MKNLFVVLLGVGFMASCNRDSDNNNAQGSELSSAEAGLRHYDPSQLEKDFTPMNESTSISGKAGSQLNYTFRGYANPVEVAHPDGSHSTVDLAASAVFQVDDIIFVAWHTNDYAALNATAPTPGTVAGSLCAYRLSGIGQYELMDRVDFEQHDLYGLAAYRNPNSGNIEVMVTGQRNTDDSQYVLSRHEGAIVARMDYDYINDEFWEGSLKELPLVGVAGTGIIALGAQYFVTTGNGIGGRGGVFQVNRALRTVIEAKLMEEIIDIQVDPTTVNKNGGDFYILCRGGQNLYIDKFSYNRTVSEKWNPSLYYYIAMNRDYDLVGNNWKYDGDGDDIKPVPQAKGHLVIAQGRTATTLKRDSMLINYGDNKGFIYKANGGNKFNGSVPVSPVMTIIDTAMSMGNFSAITFDPILGVLYCGGGEDSPGNAGLSVIAMGEYSGDEEILDPKPLVATHHLVGKLVLPSAVNTFDHLGFPVIENLGLKAINDISVYNGRNIAVSVGDKGLMFIQKDD